MRELITRWYQFGLFCPVFRTHGCRSGPSEPDESPCHPKQGSCGENEIWSYGNETQMLLARYVRLRATLAPYMRELSMNVSLRGEPTMRPLWWEFPDDEGSASINDQYFLGPHLLVAPVTTRNATTRDVYFPCGPGVTGWRSYWGGGAVEQCGSQRRTVPAPLDTIPVYMRA